MKTVAMHQPHYFPWLGYLDKMAKADEFVVLDEVQFTDGSPMSRNKLLLFDGCNYRSLLFSNPLFRGLFHF